MHMHLSLCVTSGTDGYSPALSPFLLAGPLECAVDRGTAHGAQFGNLRHGVLAIGMQLDQVCFLPRREFRLLPAQPALGLGYPHPFPGACADEVTFKLSDHGQDIKQQLADRGGGIMNRTADAEFYAACN